MKKNWIKNISALLILTSSIACSKKQMFLQTEENAKRNGIPNCEIKDSETLMNIGKNYSQVTDHCVLMNDIDIQIQSWVPIVGFKGKLDGQNFKIKNLKIDNANGSNLGLFSALSGTASNPILIENLIFEAPEIIGKNRMGILVGLGTYVQINNVQVIQGNLNGNSDIGGLIGRLSYGKISKSKFEGNIEGLSNNIGGIAGGLLSLSSIKESFAQVVLTTFGANNGGLVGNVKQSTITNTYAIGQMSVQDDFGGGLIGYMYNTDLVSSYANVAIVQTRNQKIYNAIGGLIGTLNPLSSIKDSYYPSNLGLTGPGQAIVFEAQNFQGFNQQIWNLPQQGNPSLIFFQ